MAVKVLEKQGHSVVVAGDGEKALDLLEEERFDVVLMDVQMPAMDGLEATGVIRARELEVAPIRNGQPARRIPIIAMTAHALKGDRERCIEAGMDDYLSKPIEPEKLYMVLEKWRPKV